jgi:hypothetical protein
MAGQLKVIAPVAYLPNAVANIYTPPAATIYTVIRHIHLANVTNVAATFTLYIGLTGGSAGGTEIFKAFSLGPNATYDWFPNRKMLSTDFLTGLASASSTITIEVTGEQTVV